MNITIIIVSASQTNRLNYSQLNPFHPAEKASLVDEAVVVDEAFTQKGCPLHKEDDDAENELDNSFNRSRNRRQLTITDETDEEDREETIEETSVALTANPGASKSGPQTSGKRLKQYRWDAGNKRAYL